MAHLVCSHYLVMINGRFVIVHESAQVISALCLSSLTSSLVWIVFVTRGDPPSSTRLAHTSPQPPRARTLRAMTTTKTRDDATHANRRQARPSPARVTSIRALHVIASLDRFRDARRPSLVVARTHTPAPRARTPRVMTTTKTSGGVTHVSHRHARVTRARHPRASRRFARSTSSPVWIVFVTRGDPPSSSRTHTHPHPTPPRARTPRVITCAALPHCFGSSPTSSG